MKRHPFISLSHNTSALITISQHHNWHHILCNGVHVANFGNERAKTTLYALMLYLSPKLNNHHCGQ